MSFGFFKTVPKASACPGVEAKSPLLPSPLKSALSICSGTVLIRPSSSFFCRESAFQVLHA